MNERRVLVGIDAAATVELAADLLASIAREAVNTRGQFTLALSGGTTPQALYRDLATPRRVESVPWQQTRIFFGDERDVHADHADSNYSMAQRTLLEDVPLRLENVHPMHADADDLDQAAAQYAARISDLVPAGSAGLPAFDLILLGIGADGHTASLFADTPALDETSKLVVTQFVPAVGRRRMTFTFSLINAARNVLCLVTGPEKAEAVSKVLSDDPAVAQSLPAGRIHPTDGTLHFVLDAHAARQVPHGPPSAASGDR